MKNQHPVSVTVLGYQFIRDDGFPVSNIQPTIEEAEEVAKFSSGRFYRVEQNEFGISCLKYLHSREMSDSHSSSTANRKPTREERLEKVLMELIETHFFGKGLEWAWKEGGSLEDIDPDLHKEIVDLLK